MVTSTEKKQVDSFGSKRGAFEPYGLTCEKWTLSFMSRPDHHNEIKLNLLKSGSVTYMLGGQKVVIETGKLCLFWAAIPHQVIDYSADLDYLVATIPLENFLSWQLPNKFVWPLMRGSLLSEKTTVNAVGDANLFERWQNDLNSQNGELEKPVLLEMQARLTRMAIATADTINSHKIEKLNKANLNSAEKMACYIAQNYGQKITVQQISDYVNLRSNYAMALFNKTFGSTIINYLTGYRVSHAQRLLSTTDQSITEIAYQSGFQSISRFNDAFCKLSGCSPSEYRKLYKISDITILNDS
ncbi:MAG: DUF3769 domain-containing protein [Marinagarivorans sp.]|nr:DUF3769 domain-containing protein [Marinagarivorans sp.]